MTWQPISTAPNGERVLVAGWRPASRGVRGYWWWYEDDIYDGRAIEHPDAILWAPVVLPAFPEPPEDAP